MATSTKTETSKGQPAPKSTSSKADEATYTDQALALADDTRALADSIRADLDKLTDRISGFGDLTPGDGDGATADGVRRLPMAIAEVRRALAALDLEGAELARTAATG